MNAAKTEPKKTSSKAQAASAQNSATVASKESSSVLASIPAPFERGSDQAAPLARADDLEPFARAPRQDGRPSFWERPSHALPDRKGLPRGACILAKAYGFENYQIVRGHESADNFQMTIRLTGCQLAAGRALAGLSRHELAERAGLSYHS